MYCFEHIYNSESPRVEQEIVFRCPSGHKETSLGEIQERLGTINITVVGNINVYSHGEMDRTTGIIYSLVATFSLLCLGLTFLVYWFLPSFDNIHSKIVLMNIAGIALVMSSSSPSSTARKSGESSTP